MASDDGDDFDDLPSGDDDADWHQDEYPADDEGEGEEADGAPGTAVPPSEAELARRAALTAFITAHNARIRGERANPYADVHVGYLVDFYVSPRFAELEASVRHAVLLHVVHHHERHVLHNEGAVAPDPAPYLRRHQARSRATDSFAVGDPPRIDEHPLQQPAAVVHPDGTASRGRPGEVASDRPPSPSAIVTPARYPTSVPVAAGATSSGRGAGGGTGVKLTTRLQLALVREADAHLRCVLGRYPNLAERAERCIREAKLLGEHLGRASERAFSATRAQRDPSHLYRRLEEVLAHPQVGEELRSITDIYNGINEGFLNLQPGQVPGHEHQPERLDEGLQAHPVGALVLRRFLQLPPQPGLPFGRPTRPLSEANRAARRLDRQRQSHKERRKGKACVPVVDCAAVPVEVDVRGGLRIAVAGTTASSRFHSAIVR